jgi:hypothetical protein
VAAISSASLIASRSAFATIHAGLLSDDREAPGARRRIRASPPARARSRCRAKALGVVGLVTSDDHPASWLAGGCGAERSIVSLYRRGVILLVEYGRNLLLCNAVWRRDCLGSRKRPHVATHRDGGSI